MPGKALLRLATDCESDGVDELCARTLLTYTFLVTPYPTPSLQCPLSSDLCTSKPDYSQWSEGTILNTTDRIEGAVASSFDMRFYSQLSIQGEEGDEGDPFRFPRQPGFCTREIFRTKLDRATACPGPGLTLYLAIDLSAASEEYEGVISFRARDLGGRCRFSCNVECHVPGRVLSFAPY